MPDPKSIGGLVYANDLTGECTSDRETALAWVLRNQKVSIHGYFTYEWEGLKLKEVWH